MISRFLTAVGSTLCVGTASAAPLIFLSTSNVDPLLGSTALELAPGEAGTLYVWVDPDGDPIITPDEASITGLSLDLVSEDPSVLEATGFTIYNPTIVLSPFFSDTRWQGVGSGTLGDLVDDSNAVSVTTGLGIDPDLGTIDPLTDALGVNFLHGQVDFVATGSGTTTVTPATGGLLIVDEFGSQLFPNYLSATVTVTPIPEPAIGGVVLVGLVGLAARRRRRA